MITRLLDSGGEAVAYATQDALTGDMIVGRNGPTREQLDYTCAVSTPYRMLARNVRPDLRPAIAVAEGLHLIAGTHHGDLMEAITADIDSVRWTSNELAPAEVLRHQIIPVIAELVANPETRRAYATLWAPGDIHHRADQACAVGLQFILRDGLLRLTVGMRSNDVWYGLPYNLFAFGMLQATVAWALGCLAGQYTHRVGSLHLYERHVKAARNVSLPGLEGVPPLGHIGPPARLLQLNAGFPLTDAADRYLEARDRADLLLAGNLPLRPNETEEWCYRTLVEAAG